jgi:hypothetical protein
MAKSSPIPEIVLSGTLALVIWKMASDRGMTVPQFMKYLLSSEAARSPAEVPHAANKENTMSAETVG